MNADPPKWRSWLKWTIIALSGICIIIILLILYIYVELMGMGGWEPHKDSVYALRAKRIDAKLHLGMTRPEVKRIFQTDITANRGDNTEDTSNAYWGPGVPTWPDESDLYITESRPHFWSSFDTGWTIRAAFDSHGNLIHHRLEMDAIGGP